MVADPGSSGFGWLSCGAQPLSQTNVEGRAQAPVRVGEALGIDFGRARQHVAPKRLAAAGVQRVRAPKARRSAHQREHVAVARGRAVEIDHRQREAGPLREPPKRAHVDEGRDPRRGAADNFALRDRQALTKFGQAVAAEERRDQQAVGSERAAASAPARPADR